jgi:uncharacterized membrane protein
MVLAYSVFGTYARVILSLIILLWYTIHNMHESHFRSVLKGVTWRVIASVTTMIVVYIVTKDLTLVASVGLVDVFAKLFFYYIHERTWGKVKWGIVGTTPNFDEKDCDCDHSQKIA